MPQPGIPPLPAPITDIHDGNDWTCTRNCGRINPADASNCGRCGRPWAASTTDQADQRAQRTARIKCELLDHAQWATVGIVLIGLGITLDTLLHHSRAPISVLTVAIAAVGMASLVNGLLDVTLADLRDRLYTAATSSKGADR